MKSKTFLGILLVLLGVLFIIDNTTNIGFSQIIHTWWPIIFILFSLHLIRKKNSPTLFSIILGFFGLLLLAQKLDIIQGGFGDIFWPLVLVAIGVSFLFPRWGFLSHKHRYIDGLNLNSVFGSLNRKIDDKNFKGANISIVFGGAEIDFGNAIIEKEAVLNIDSAFASVDIFVPSNWNINVIGNPIFGSFSDKRRHKELTDNSPLLTINNNVVFGSLEIKD